jgi:hypothetical protein
MRPDRTGVIFDSMERWREISALRAVISKQVWKMTGRSGFEQAAADARTGIDRFRDMFEKG